MSIQREISKRLKKKEEEHNPSYDIYDLQVKSIYNIKDTDWYKEIVSFWEREKENALSELTTTTADKLDKLQAKYEISNSFVMFLNRLANAKDLKKVTNSK